MSDDEDHPSVSGALGPQYGANEATDCSWQTRNKQAMKARQHQVAEKQSPRLPDAQPQRQVDGETWKRVTAMMFGGNNPLVTPLPTGLKPHTRSVPAQVALERAISLNAQNLATAPFHRQATQARQNDTLEEDTDMALAIALSLGGMECPDQAIPKAPGYATNAICGCRGHTHRLSRSMR